MWATCNTVSPEYKLQFTAWVAQESSWLMAHKFSILIVKHGTL